MQNDNGDLPGEVEELLGLEPDESGRGTTLERNDLESTFRTPQQTDVTRLLISAATKEALSGLFMRCDIPDKRFAIAMSSLISKCRRHGYGEGESELTLIVTALNSIKAKRANLVSDTLIGEKSNRNSESGVNKFKAWAMGKSGHDSE